MESGFLSLITTSVFADTPAFTDLPDADFGSSLSTQIISILTIKNIINIIVTIAMSIKLIITVFKVAKGRGDESWDAIVGWGVGIIIWELVMNYLV
jgi:hypothetical protein